MKTCTKCGEVKPLDEFHRDGKGGRRSDCKVCISAYYRANREQILAYNRAYYRANREEVSARKRAYNRAYYEANRERIDARTGARKRSLEPHCEDTLEYMRWLREDPCSYCGKWPEPGEASAIDHIVPVSAGGANHWTNLTAACGPCNFSKGSKPLLQWLVERARWEYGGRTGYANL